VTGRHAGPPKQGGRDRPLIGPGTLIRHPVKWIKLARALRADMPQYQPGRHFPLFREHFLFRCPDRSKPPFAVILELDAGQWLSGPKSLPRRVTDPRDRIDVWLDSAAHPSSESPVRVHVNERLVGVLRPDDGTVFWSDIERAQLNGSWVMTSGFRSFADDGTMHFHVYQPQ
jgi:hypothetical protein